LKNKQKFIMLGFCVALIAMALGLHMYMEHRPEKAVQASADTTSAAVTAQGTGKGIEGDVVVEVTADANQIYSITVVEQNETQGIGSVACDELPGKMVEAQSYNVDGIAGATVTSDALKNAVKDALEKAGLSVAAFETAKASGSETAARTDETLECDVVIVGAGGAGLTAAAQAAENGANVIVVEKMPLVGGNSLKATGGMNAAGTTYQEALGITDSGVQDFIEDTMSGGHEINDKELVTTMAEESSDAIDWLTSIGAPLPKVAATGGTTHKYLHEPEDGSAVGSYLVEKLNAQVEKLGVPVMLNTKATEILTENGKAVGILAEDEEHNYTIKAKAVILATGGFGSNFELMASFNPDLANAVTTNHAGATGDGILMAEAIGADTVDMDQIQLHPTVYQETGLLVSESVRSMGGILVNAEGKRFCNDMSTRDAVSAAELQQTGAYAYIIFDQRIVDDLSSCQKYIKNGLTVTSDTYEGLAKEMGLTGDAVQNFCDTMDTWNAAVAAGEDKEFGRNNGMDEDLSTAPYYAIKIAPGIHHTMGGLKINTETEVLNTSGEWIEGLYAAGETTGGVHGGNRIGGNAVCDFVVFGRIAGKNAAAYAASN
jgi:fumarate reductase flavoprotein subunit